MATQENYKFDVFISYRSIDREFVKRKLLLPLEAAGLKVAIDYRDFGFGQWTESNISTAITQSRYTLLALTPAWVKSEWCEFEARRSRHTDPAAKAGRVIPVILQKCEVPEYLNFLHWCDLTDARHFNSNLRSLIENLKPAHKET